MLRSLHRRACLWLGGYVVVLAGVAGGLGPESRGTGQTESDGDANKDTEVPHSILLLSLCLHMVQLYPAEYLHATSASPMYT